MPRNPPSQETRPIPVPALNEPNSPYPEAVPVTHAPPETLELAPEEPAPAKPNRYENSLKLPDGTPLQGITREALMHHLSGNKAPFVQPEAHQPKPTPRPQLTENQRKQLELESARGAERVAYHASEAARFKMPPRVEPEYPAPAPGWQPGRTEAPVTEPRNQTIGRTEEQAAWVPKRERIHGRAEGENQAGAVLPKAGVVSGV